MTTRFTWLQKLKLPSWWDEKIRSGLWWLWQKITQYPFVMGVIVVLLLIAFIFAAYLFKWDWTAFNSGTNQITITSTSKGNYTAAVSQPAKALWDWLLLLSSVATTSAIVAGGLWFIINRSFVQEAQVSLSHKDVVIVNGLLIAIVEVRFKNLGRTKIEKLEFFYSTKPIDVEPNSERISLISEDPYDYPIFKPIFYDPKTRETHVIEPNEEKSWDMAFAVDKPTLFRVSMRARQVGTGLYWETVAVFNVDDKAKVPTQYL